MAKTFKHEPPVKTVYDVFVERGFIEKVTDEEKVPEILEGKVTCYIGFDPTASSFHVGNLVPIMSLAHMQRHGHQPIALVGGGTGLVGDPSGKDEMRQMMTYEEINRNAEAQKKQFAHFLDFSKDRALLLSKRSSTVSRSGSSSAPSRHGRCWPSTARRRSSSPA